MTNLEALRALQDLFADPRRWTTRVLARDADGQPTDYFPHPDTIRPPTCWCIMGGISKVTNSLSVYDSPLAPIINRAAQRLYNEVPETVNDVRGIDAVRLVIADAITAELSHAD